VTVTCIVPDIVPLEALMLATPFPLALTRPVADTAAIVLAVLDH
jgi:hypothetical protein